MSSGAMQSKVGNPQVYNDGDQRTSKGDSNSAPRYEAGEANSHQLLDSKDERSLSNTLSAAQRAEKVEERRDTERNSATKDPLRPAQDHGNEPSRGAQVDAELQAEEEEYLRNKKRI